MTQGWFASGDADDVGALSASVREGSAGAPADWPTEAVEAGFATDTDEYYDALHAATMAAARTAVRERERATDQQLVHAVRGVADLTSTVNELAERVAEWAGSLFDESGTGVEYAREVAGREPSDVTEERVVSLAERVRDLANERANLEAYVEEQSRVVAPNLSMLAGPTLAARLVEQAGGLESLAKMPSGTVQVLGAEDALFAHLRGHAPSPKHGVIYVHEYVRGTRPDERGSAARAIAGKLSIAARIDHYSGDRRPELEDELDERIERIRSRGDE
ncbi:NOP5/NOP56 family protein [Salarchaeum sp. JOR-1]|uniref:NOP5/NOP56 family protein n=1 Tax=Salarchaeum sp. JOR-1 TaxID=2599399 RepID=UPI00119862D0|nr:NOP5/NOP56 family protein [Salarchaeum sp. JOR-1]QDX40877.1 NOP58 family protein [Salarchaeum sp. JOR-1]